MMRLAFSDLRDHAATWIGAFLVAVGCGYIGGWAVSIEASAETFDVLRSVGSVVIAFSSVAAVAVLALTANLTAVSYTHLDVYKRQAFAFSFVFQYGVLLQELSDDTI